jgi:cytoskeletal protein CcmA (bactofilin family)
VIKRETTVTIDPVALRITNKIDEGTYTRGAMECSGGLLLQGEFHGQLVVRGGPLVMYAGSRLSGQTTVHGDAFVFGQLGDANDDMSVLTVLGTLHLTKDAVAYGQLRCRYLSTYDGAKVHGRLETLQEEVQLATPRVELGLNS